jgi:hypothetical protein
MVVGTTSSRIITRNSKNESGSTVRFLFAPAQVLSWAQVLSPTGKPIPTILRTGLLKNPEKNFRKKKGHPTKMSDFDTTFHFSLQRLCNCRL